MTPRTALDAQLQRLLDLTETAIRQARIRQTDELTLTLAERKRVLAVIWGFDPEAELPPFSPEEAENRRARLGGYDKAIAARLQELESELLPAIQHHLGALRDESRTLNNGGRFLESMRSTYRVDRTARRVDQTG